MGRGSRGGISMRLHCLECKMAIQFEAPIPLLRIFDETKAREFYPDCRGL
jgi:hypothetical protein